MTFLKPKQTVGLGNVGIVRSTSLLLAIGFAVLLGIVAVTYMLAEFSRASFDEVIAARDTRTAAVDLRNALLTAETSQRGFVYNGNEIYLAPYDTAKTLASRRYDKLRRLLADDPASAGPLDRLKVIMAEKFAEMDNTIAYKRQRQDDDVAAIFNSNRGKALMDEANVFLTGIMLAADDRLTASVAEQKANSAWLRWITIAGGVAIVVVVGFAVASVARYTRALSIAQRNLATLNTGLEERVKERTADLVRANDEIQRFAYIVTHDLRAPLVNIMGFTSELETGVASMQALIEKSGIGADSADPIVADARAAAAEDLPEAIGFIRSSTRKMDGLINAILRLSREGRRPLNAEWISLAELVNNSASTVQHQVMEAGGEISLDLGVTRIESDRPSLEQVFTNLMDNAVKYRSRERPLKIQVGARIIPGNRVAIEIEDNGRGIANQDLDRIFELFRRSGVQDQQGEGIGLAYVRSVVRRLGGEIGVKSTLDAGTTFRIELPLTATFVERTAA
jgi:CHASE3 domain sensor protein/two-component sensor histidine kinase